MKWDSEFWYHNWPRVGIVITPFLVALLVFNSQAPIGGVIWWCWLCLPLYMVHQFEEYVFPGGFEAEINQILGNGQPKEILTPKAAFYINIGFIWVLSPLLIILGRVSIVFPAAMATLVGVNGVTHVVAALCFRRYNPGLGFSVLFNIPLSTYILATMKMEQLATWPQLVAGVVSGIILHATLFVFLIVRRRKLRLIARASFSENVD